MKTVAVVMQKGGVGKTTTTYNLAYAKAREGKRVCMVDLDPQASLTLACNFDPMAEDFDKMNICSVFHRALIASCCFNIDDSDVKMYLIPSRLDLQNIDRSPQILYDNKVLRSLLKPLEQYIDYIFIDCPPALSPLTKNALTAADEAIVPCTTEYLSYKALEAILTTIPVIQKRDNPELTYGGVVVIKYDSRTNDQRDVLDLIRQKTNVLGVVKYSADVPREVYQGKCVCQTHPSSDPARAYYAIAQQI